MCLGIPGQVSVIYLEHGLKMGQVDFGGITKSVCLEHVGEVELGDYVLVHVGFALTRLDCQEAARILQMLEELTLMSQPEPALAAEDSP